MKMKKLVKSSVASSIALLLLSNTVDAAQHITPVSEKKSRWQNHFIQNNSNIW